MMAHENYFDAVTEENLLVVIQNSSPSASEKRTLMLTPLLNRENYQNVMMMRMNSTNLFADYLTNAVAAVSLVVVVLRLMTARMMMMMLIVRSLSIVFLHLQSRIWRENLK